MIVRLFRSQYLVQYVLLFFLTVLLWTDALLFPEKLITGEGFKSFPSIKNFVLSYPLISLIVSILLLYFQALLLNAVAGLHRLVERNQLIVAAIYVLIMSSQPAMIQPNVMLLVNFLLILMLYVNMKLFGTNESLSALFDMGFLVGLSSLLYFPSIAFLPFIFISLLVYQLFRWREWLVPIIGFFTPYLFIMVWYFWNDQLDEKFSYFLSLFDFEQPAYQDVSTENIVIWGLFAMLVLLGLGRILKLASDGSVEGRKKSRVVIFMFLFAVASAFFSGQTLISHLYLEIIPVVVFLSAYVSRLRKLFIIELVFSLIFISIIAIKVLNFS